jgi:hypothetical protein
MANDAFALSPISARATQPSEEDYDAISEAFMETARGRWFLGEYAKRNRNADTRLVLDAVARLEQNLATQKQPVPVDRLPEALTAIKAALDAARAAASVTLDSLALEDHLAPVRKGVRVIKEISWRWREIGADGRICDLIDQQVGAIEASCGHIASIDPRTALSAVFDLIENRIAAFDDNRAAPAKAATDTPSPSSPADSVETPAATMEQTPPATAPDEDEASVSAEMPQADAIAAEADAETAVEADAAMAEVADIEVTDMPDQGASEPATEAAKMTAEAVDADAEDAEAQDAEAQDAEAHDDAVLDMVAFEMAAPDPYEEEMDADDEIDVGVAAAHSAEPSPAELEAVAEMAEMPAEATIAPVMAAPPVTMAPVMQPAPIAALEAAPQAVTEAPPQASLGSTLVASGIVRKPASLMPDPLAAIRRLSQAEKVALFS